MAWEEQGGGAANDGFDIDTNGPSGDRRRDSSRMDPDLAGGQPETPLDAKPANAMERATGSLPSDSLRAPELQAFADDGPSFGLLGRREATYDILAPPTPEVLRDPEPPGAGERVAEWTRARDMKESNPIEFVGDFVRGVADFATAWRELQSINTVGADNYYHCSANCNAASRGPGGQLASHAASWAREALWAPKTLYNTGSISGAWDDILDDNRQNEVGRREGQRIWFEGDSTGTRCRDTCLELVPPSSRGSIP